MKISIIGPVKNEAPWIGYSIMAVLPYIHELVYALAASDDGTGELLDYIKEKYAGDKLTILKASEFDFNPKEQEAYNNAFNACIARSTGDACWFLHPDMVCTNPEKILDLKPGPLAWWTNMTSYAGDFDRQITKGRATRWKNIHAKNFGLHYYGAYGSVNEDMYHKFITGNSYQFHGTDFKKYPFPVADSGLNVNHYCEMKGYRRRFEKMKACLRTLFPKWTDARIEEAATHHPRVTLEPSSDVFGEFEFKKGESAVPPVFEKYRDEFNSVLGREEHVAVA